MNKSDAQRAGAALGIAAASLGMEAAQIVAMMQAEKGLV
jgi:TPP-dependent pyruvate/acetoin dehydrogenase alpha subunit